MPNLMLRSLRYINA